MKTAVIVLPASNCDRDIAPVREYGQIKKSGGTPAVTQK